MLELKFIYRTTITFSENISRHHFLLRCLPAALPFQKVKNEWVKISPEVPVSFGTDSFGNRVITGIVDFPHNHFEFESSGIILRGHYHRQEPLNRLYLYPSKYTQAMDAIVSLAREIHFSADSSTHEKVALLSEKIHQKISYEPGSTNVTTTASEALALGVGVCQDYAHILITLCRLKEIPARYVNGFLPGEGFTHAWVEYYDQGAWHGFDPTHNRPVDLGYVIVAQGRDYADCVIDKGVFSGLAQQKMEVNLKVFIEQ